MKAYFRAVLHSYSLLFFSQHRGFAWLLLLASFANPQAGAAGLVAAGLAVGLARAAGFSRELTQLGTYSFNALLVGLALGTFYAPSAGFWLVLVVGALFALLMSVALAGWLNPRGLPTLALPFLAVVWVLTPAAEHFHRLGLSEGSIYWLNDVYALGGDQLVGLVQRLNEVPLPHLLRTFLRALSAVLFQDSVLGGLLVAAGLLWHSRIAFSLMTLAFFGAYGFALLAGAQPDSLNHYDLGANYMMTALAVGGVFLVPSWRSYAVALLTVPISAALVAGLGRLLAGPTLPVFSLPFCLAALLFLYCLLLRTEAGRLPLTPFQLYSPERNLYAWLNDQERLHHWFSFRLSLPFRGEWRVTQGYDGGLTHQGEWGQALDFMVADEDQRTWQHQGLNLTDFYCYNKPVLAPADGVVEAVVMHVEDNLIGQTNSAQNWGNSIVIKHLPDLFTQVSHLRPHSAQVRVGDFVRRGEVLAYCGNSGRSAEPHLHFQVQATPYVGSRTKAYPLAYFLSRDECCQRLRSYAVPAEGDAVRNPEPLPLLTQALNLQPGYRLEVRDAAHPAAPAQCWEVRTDAWNKTYLLCHHTGATAYFERNESVFLFTAYHGPRTAWLHQLYRAAYRVPLTFLPQQTIRDTFPLSVVGSRPLTWLQDVLAPFYVFVRPTFELTYAADSPHRPRSLHLLGRSAVRVAGRVRHEQETDLELRDGALASLTVRQGAQPILQLLCTPASA